MKEIEKSNSGKYGGKLMPHDFIKLAAIVIIVAGSSIADATPTRWRIENGGSRIVWDVASDARLPHEDRFEMSGLRASLIFSYDVADDRSLSLDRWTCASQVNLLSSNNC